MGKRSLLDHYFSSQRPLFSLSDRVWNPPTDIYEIANATVIRMEVAGIDEEHLKIFSKNDMLIVRGRRRQPMEDQAVIYQMMEVHYGHFERRFMFSYPLEQVKVDASYEKGFLIIQVPKAPSEAKGKNIEIKIVADSVAEGDGPRRHLTSREDDDTHER